MCGRKKAGLSASGTAVVGDAFLAGAVAGVTTRLPVRPLGGVALHESAAATVHAVGALDHRLRHWTLGPASVFAVGTILEDTDVMERRVVSALDCDDVESVLTDTAGTFSLVVAQEEEVVLYTDLCGLQPLFYAIVDGAVCFATRLTPLHEFAHGVDLAWHATHLMAPIIPDLSEARSPLRDVRRVPAGHRLLAGRQGVRVEPYWRAPAPDVPIEEAARSYRTALRKAIDERISRSRTPTSDLSGGLDSGTLVALAAEALPPATTLSTFTYTSIGSGSAGDEQVAAESSRLESIDPHVLAGRSLPQHYSDLDGVPLTDEPSTVAYSHGREAAFYRAVAAVGSDVHLDGEGGDESLVPPLGYLADLVRVRSSGDFLRHARGWAQLKGLSVRQLVGGAVQTSRTDYPRWVDHSVPRIAPPRQDSWMPAHRMGRTLVGWTFPARSTSWLTATAHDAARSTVGSAFQLAESCGQHGTVAAILAAGRRYRGIQQTAARYGVDVQFPFLDPRVVVACLSAEVPARGNPFEPKPLLRRAMSDLVPPAVIDRSTKGDYTEDVYVGLRRNVGRVRELFRDSLAAAAGLIDESEFHHAITRAATGLPVNLWLLNQTISIELWLRRVADTARDRYWMPVPSGLVTGAEKG